MESGPVRVYHVPSLAALNGRGDYNYSAASSVTLTRAHCPCGQRTECKTPRNQRKSKRLHSQKRQSSVDVVTRI